MFCIFDAIISGENQIHSFLIFLFFSSSSCDELTSKLHACKACNFKEPRSGSPFALMICIFDAIISGENQRTKTRWKIKKTREFCIIEKER